LIRNIDHVSDFKNNFDRVLRTVVSLVLCVSIYSQMNSILKDYNNKIIAVRCTFGNITGFYRLFEEEKCHESVNDAGPDGSLPFSSGSGQFC